MAKKNVPVYESFKYIHPPAYEHKSWEVMETKYKSADDLSGKFVAYAHGIGYRVYPNVSDFHEHLNIMDIRERVYHEVIFNQPQKLKFDIDATLDNLSAFTIPTEESDESMIIPPVQIEDPEITALLGELNVEVENLSNTKQVDTNTAKYNVVFDAILRAIKDTFFITYGIDLKQNRVIICESRDPDAESQTKYSNHIIIDDYRVANYEQAKEFTRRVASYLGGEYKKFLDMSVNKCIQNFRIVGCHKTDDNRTKVVISGQNPLRCFITEVADCEQLPDIVMQNTNPRTFRTDMHPDDVNKVLAICKQNGMLTDHKYKFDRNGMFIFSRQRPSHCEFCQRIHDSDNTLIVTTQNIDGVITVFKQCRKYIEENGKNGTHVAPIGEFPSSTAPVEIVNETDQRLNEKKIFSWVDRNIVKYVGELEHGGELYPTRNLFDDLPGQLKHIYFEPQLAPFELTKTLVVHAMMKMGKTKALRDYITKHFADGLRTPIIRFVSFRQTFSSNIKEKFTDFILYSDVKGPLGQTKLIVQVESLWRLDIREGVDAPDLLILDECESIFEQFDSGLLRNFSECFSKFQYLLRYSKHVVCMDANIGDRTYRILKQMRPGFGDPESGIVYHCNRYKNATADEYFVTGDKLKWLGLLYSCIEADERIAVPMSSLTEAKSLVKNLSKRYSTKNIKLYSSETAMSEKREHFADVNTHWAQYDILVYTPTVSAGVSFEQKHFQKVFGYFTDQSCPVETCVQMIGRIRDVEHHKFYICMCATGNTLPTDIDAIKQYVYTKRENLMRTFDDTGLHSEFGPNGEIRYHTSDYFYLWLENTRVRNLSKNSFIRKLMHLFAFTGAKVSHLSDQVFEDNTGLQMQVDGELNTELEALREAHLNAKTEVRKEICKKIAASKDLNEHEVEEIHSAMIAQQDISEEQKYAFEKHRLRVDYRYEGDIDEKFVDKYRDMRVRRIFKNITRIASCDTVEDALKQIQAEEAANYLYVMDLDEKYQHQDLNRKYVFDRHRYALGLLKLCGWKNINDPQFIHKVMLAQNLRAKDKIYWESIKPACTEFQIRAPSLQTVLANKANDDSYVTLLIRPINKILSAMYGVQIISKKNDPNMFFLAHNTLFTLDPVKSREKCLPLIVPLKKTIQLNGFDDAK